MSLLVDTSVWSLALRRDQTELDPAVAALRRALAGQDLVATTGVVLQEILQGAVHGTTRERVLEHFGRLQYVAPDRDDHVAAAELRKGCRQHGVQLGTIDALIAALTIRHGLTLLTTDQDFTFAARWVPLPLWRAP